MVKLDIIASYAVFPWSWFLWTQRNKKYITNHSQGTNRRIHINQTKGRAVSVSAFCRHRVVVPRDALNVLITMWARETGSSVVIKRQGQECWHAFSGITESVMWWEQFIVNTLRFLSKRVNGSSQKTFWLVFQHPSGSLFQVVEYTEILSSGTSLRGTCVILWDWSFLNGLVDFWQKTGS